MITNHISRQKSAAIDICLCLRSAGPEISKYSNMTLKASCFTIGDVLLIISSYPCCSEGHGPTTYFLLFNLEDSKGLYENYWGGEGG